jgi:hypothetical protein
MIGRLLRVITQSAGKLFASSGRNSKGDMIWKAAATGNEGDRGLKKHVDVVKEQTKEIDKMGAREPDVLDHDDGLNAQLEEAKERSIRELSQAKASNPGYDEAAKQVMKETEKRWPGKQAHEDVGEAEADSGGKQMDGLREKIKEEVDSIHAPAEDAVAAVMSGFNKVTDLLAGNTEKEIKQRKEDQAKKDAAEGKGVKPTKQAREGEEDVWW